MTDKLNERERQMFCVAWEMGFDSGYCASGTAEDVLDNPVRVARVAAKLPPDPNLARITELEAEVVSTRAELMRARMCLMDSAAGLSLMDVEKDNIALRSEVERLNGLLDEVELWLASNVETARPDWATPYAILSRRTAAGGAGERKEPTDASD